MKDNNNNIYFEYSIKYLANFNQIINNCNDSTDIDEDIKFFKEHSKSLEGFLCKYFSLLHVNNEETLIELPLLCYENIDSEKDLIASHLNWANNCCFFDAVSWLLFDIVEFREFIIKHEFLFFGNQPIIDLINLFKKMKQNSGGVVRLSDPIIGNRTRNDFYLWVQRTIFIPNDPDPNNISGNNHDGSQRDAHELIIAINNLFSEHIENMLDLKNKFKNKEIDDIYFYIKLNESRALPLSNIISKYIYLDHIKCTKKVFNFKKNITPYDFIDIAEPDISKQYSFNFDTNLEILSNTNSVNDCRPEDTEKYMFNIFLGNYIIVRLNRLFWHNRMPYNDQRGIENFSDNFEIKYKSQIYTLTGCIVKSGGPGGGHYWYYGKHNNNWYRYDDMGSIQANVSPVGEQGMISILCFRKCEEEYIIPEYNDSEHFCNSILNLFKD